MNQLELDDVTISYEVTGHGEPMLLVHGNGEDHRIFDRSVDVLKHYYTCYLIDSRGHGRSSSVSEFHYRDMAKDMVLFMERLHLDHVTYTGFSDGGIIGLMTAAMTQRITNLIVCGANQKPEGLKAVFIWGMRLVTLFQKKPLIRLMLEEPDISDDELRSIRANTLVMAGQYDLIRRKETDHIASVIPHAKELILPRETHTSYVVHSDKLGRMILNQKSWLRNA